MLQGHHYQSNDLNAACQCSVARWGGVAVGFVATIAQPGVKETGLTYAESRIAHRESRLVVLPGAAPRPSVLVDP